MEMENNSGSVSSPSHGTQQTKSVVLDPNKYGWKVFLMFSDIFAVVVFMLYYMIRDIYVSVQNKTFSWVSLSTIAFYIFMGSIIIFPLVFWILRKKGAIRTRIDKDNELRQNPSIHVWLVDFNWTRLVLFVPTIAFLLLASLVGFLANWLVPENALTVVQRCIGGAVIGFFILNTSVVLFEFTWTKIGFVLCFLGFMALLITLAGLFCSIFGKIKYLGIRVDPAGYLLIAYVLLNFLRFIWLNGLFNYLVLAPNRLDDQSGSSESGKGTKSANFSVSVNTHDVIERAFGMGQLVINFTNLEKPTAVLNVCNIGKKAKYAVAVASTTSIDSGAIS